MESYTVFYPFFQKIYSEIEAKLLLVFSLINGFLIIFSPFTRHNPTYPS